VTSIDENRLSNVPAPTDLWGQFKDLPVIGNVRVGNQKPLYSFEHMTSSRFLNFLERSLNFDAFVEGFNNGFAPGITVFDTFARKRGTWGVGLFKNTRSIFGWNTGRNEAEVNGRLTLLPVYAENGRYLVHLGVGGAFRDLDDGQQRHRARLDARNSPSAFSPLIADTGLYFGSQQQLLIPEFVVVAGPWSFQSEYYGSWVQGASVPLAGGGFDTLGTVYLQGVYGELHYFLTGEHREYDRNTGVFTRVVPRRPLSWSRCGFTGCGAWQVAARYTYLDLNDKAISGGSIHDMTLGLNWFLNPNMKIQWNYFLAHRNVVNPAGDGFIQGFATRLAIDF
jgi:phosphate-selective porin OprO/OprP